MAGERVRSAKQKPVTSKLTVMLGHKEARLLTWKEVQDELRGRRASEEDFLNQVYRMQGEAIIGQKRRLRPSQKNIIRDSLVQPVGDNTIYLGPLENPRDQGSEESVKMARVSARDADQTTIANRSILPFLVDAPYEIVGSPVIYTGNGHVSIPVKDDSGRIHNLGWQLVDPLGEG